MTDDDRAKIDAAYADSKTTDGRVSHLESVNADLLEALRVADRIIKVNAPQCRGAIKVVEDAISLAEKSNG